MKRQKSVSGLLVLAAIAAGCGKGPSGTYTLQQTNTGMMGNCATTQVDMSITEGGNTVNGTGSNATCISSETFTGTDNGNQLTNVRMTVTYTNQAISGYSSNYNSPYYGGNPNTYYPNSYYPNSVNNSVGITCVYTGNLNFSNNQLNGNLSLQNPQNGSTTTNNTTYSGSYGCPASISLFGNQK